MNQSLAGWRRKASSNPWKRSVPDVIQSYLPSMNHQLNVVLTDGSVDILATPEWYNVLLNSKPLGTIPTPNWRGNTEPVRIVLDDGSYDVSFHDKEMVFKKVEGEVKVEWVGDSEIRPIRKREMSTEEVDSLSKEIDSIICANGVWIEIANYWYGSQGNYPVSIDRSARVSKKHTLEYGTDKVAQVLQKWSKDINRQLTPESNERLYRGGWSVVSTFFWWVISQPLSWVRDLIIWDTWRRRDMMLNWPGPVEFKESKVVALPRLQSMQGIITRQKWENWVVYSLLLNGAWWSKTRT